MDPASNETTDCGQAVHLTITSCGMGLKYKRVVGYVLCHSTFYHRGRGFALYFIADCGFWLIFARFYGFRTPYENGSTWSRTDFGKLSRTVFYYISHIIIPDTSRTFSGLCYLFQTDANTSYRVVVWSSLKAREYSFIDRFFQVVHYFCKTRADHIHSIIKTRI